MGVIDPPQNTGVPILVDRWFGKLGTFLDSLFQRVRAIDEAKVQLISADFVMTAENVVEYVGNGGHQVTAPLAASISGRRTRTRVIINNSPVTGGAAPSAETAAAWKAVPGAIVLLPTGMDSVNGGSFLGIPAKTMAVIVSDGDTVWRAHSPLVWLVPLGGGAAPTLGTIGGSGPGTAAQAGWIKLVIGGVNYFVPGWK